MISSRAPPWNLIFFLSVWFAYSAAIQARGLSLLRFLLFTMLMVHEWIPSKEVINNLIREPSSYFTRLTTNIDDRDLKVFFYCNQFIACANAYSFCAYLKPMNVGLHTPAMHSLWSCSWPQNVVFRTDKRQTAISYLESYWCLRNDLKV